MDGKAYFIEHGLDKLIDMTVSAHATPSGINATVDPAQTTPYPPDLDDLARLHFLAISRRVTTVLEFGSGYSTLILAHAIATNANAHGAFVRKHLRRNNPFELHIVEDDARYLEITLSRLPQELRRYVYPTVSAVSMCKFNDRIATEYETLPNICPDFIYLDGPAQHGVFGNICGITTAHPDRLPMACDLLKIEHFFLPGTFILVDGRTANARFLKSNFQRNWAYASNPDEDTHRFELQEEPLGKLNRAQIDFCLGGKFSL